MAVLTKSPDDWKYIMMRLCCLAVVLPLIGGSAEFDRVGVYPAVDAFPRSADFSMKVRNPDRTWAEVPVYGVPVNTGMDIDAAVRATPKTGAGTQFGRSLTSIASFDFSGTAEVTITWKHGTPKSAKVRPKSYGILPSVSGNELHFVLTQPRYLSIEIDGDIFHNLHLFADAMEAGRPSETDSNVIYYGPGTHEVGEVEVPSGKTVYIAGGAVVIGNFVLSHVQDVRILGRGILAQNATTLRPSPPPRPRAGPARRRDAILVEFSKNVVIDGITEVPSSYSVLIGQSEEVTVRNVKSFSAGGNNDGIDVFSSKHVRIERVFMRNSDDCIAIYGHRWAYFGDVADVIVRDSTLWADVAHPILVGTHGDSEKPETLSQLRFENIDILDHREPQIDYQGCMSLNAGDSNLIKDVVFDKIRVDDFRMGQLLNIRVMYNRKYNTSPGRGVEDVTFRDVSYTGGRANMSVIAGYDDQRSVKRIVFENLKINGIAISDDMPGKPGFYKTGDIAHVLVGEHVDAVTFRRTIPSSKPD